MTSKFSVPLLGDDNQEEDDFKVNSGSLFRSHRQKIQNNILLSKSPQKSTDTDQNGKSQSINLNDSKNHANKNLSGSYLTVGSHTSSTVTNKSSTETTEHTFKNRKIQDISQTRTATSGTVIARPITESGDCNTKFLPTSSSGLLQSKESNIKLSPIRPGGSSKTSLIVSARQKGNPIIKFIRNVPWEYGDIIPDYEMGKTMCALYLSLRYHHLNPAYIHERLKQLGRSYDLRVLLVQVDVKDPHHSLTELAKISILSDITLIVAFSPEEAGRYLETYKAYENKPPDLIMEKTEGDFLSQFTDCVTCTRKVNKTDSMTLLNTFGSFENVVQADEEDLSLCPGFGPQKAKRLYEILQEPFLKAKRSKMDKSPMKSTTAAASGKTEPQPSTSTSGLS